MKSVEGEKEYLDKLYTVNGEKIKYNRRGSTSVNGINGMIDIYETYLLSGQPYKIIYINNPNAAVQIKANNYNYDTAYAGMADHKPVVSEFTYTYYK